jgi:hypothetical protein
MILLCCYFCAIGARAHFFELSDAKRRSLFWSISEEALAVIKVLGLLPVGELKATLRDTCVLREYRRMTGIDTEI